MNAISLFTGAMGFDLGIKYAGFDIKVCIEQDKWACETIRANTQIPLLESDINELSCDDILLAANVKKEDVDLVFGGPPCQPFSSAGKQKGLADVRSNTISKFIEIVSEIQPKFFLLENVRGLLSAKLNDFVPNVFSHNPKISQLKGSALYYIISEFERIGYTVSFSLFNSANYGVPQQRERVILFGHKGSERIPLPKPTHYEYNEKTKEQMEKLGIQSWVDLETALGDWVSPFGKYQAVDQENTTQFLPLRPMQRKYVSMLQGGQYWVHLPPDIQKQALGKVYDLVGGRTGFYRRLSYKAPSPTLVTVPTMPATLLCHPKYLRPLSIEEYARIQMFPETWKFQGSIANQYKQIGNAVPVGLGYMAGMQLMKFLKNPKILEDEEKVSLKHSRYKLTTDKEFIHDFRDQMSKL